MTNLRIAVRAEDWELGKPFRIARGTMTHANVVLVEVSDGAATGRGEACPTAHYGETVGGVLDQIAAAASRLEAGEAWEAIHDDVPPGAARNALDCAIWDWRAKRSGRPVWQLLGIIEPKPVETVYTISLDTPEVMAAAAAAACGHGSLKVKLGAPGDVDRVRAIRKAVPEKRLIVDVNEGWSIGDLEANLPAMAECGVEMVEQPLPAGQDDALAAIDHPVPIGADESCHTRRDLDRIGRLYDVINIKLDKTGGLTEAMALMRDGRERGLDIMVGCMLGTSLAMAPATLVAQFARFVDLDAPLLIGRDRMPALIYENGVIAPPQTILWG